MTLPHFSILGGGSHTVLMLHGAEGGHLSFAPQLETFAAAGYRAVAWDMPGYGTSYPVEPYHFKGIAEACIALIEALQKNAAHKPVVLIGHGMGAAVALEVVLRRADLVERLVLCNPLCTNTANRSIQFADIYSLFQTGNCTSMSSIAELHIPQRVGSGHLPEGVRLLTHIWSQVAPSTYRRALDAQQSFDRSAGLAQITCPTLLVTGEQDKFATPEATKQLATRLGGGASADYVQLKGIGHYANLEAPDEFDAAVLHWLSKPDLLAMLLH